MNWHYRYTEVRIISVKRQEHEAHAPAKPPVVCAFLRFGISLWIARGRSWGDEGGVVCMSHG